MTELTYRDAIAADLPKIIAMLAAEQIGGRKDDPAEPLDPAYLAAFEAIDGDPRQRLIVAELDGAIVGTMQLSWLPGLINRGAWRGQIEAVRIAADKRSLGLGAAMIGWAVGDIVIVVLPPPPSASRLPPPPGGGGLETTDARSPTGPAAANSVGGREPTH